MKQTIVFFFLLLFTLSCQEEIEPNFSFTNEQEEITLEGDANSETTFSFSSSREWEATTTSNWLSISPTSGEAGSQRITLTATSENATGTTRSATVLLTSLTLTHEITVKQSASDFVALEQETYQIPAAGDIVNIQFLTNVEDDELSNLWNCSRLAGTRYKNSIHQFIYHQSARFAQHRKKFPNSLCALL